jgi:hypothetical protein
MISFKTSLSKLQVLTIVWLVIAIVISWNLGYVYGKSSAKLIEEFLPQYENYNLAGYIKNLNPNYDYCIEKNVLKRLNEVSKNVSWNDDYVEINLGEIYSKYLVKEKDGLICFTEAYFLLNQTISDFVYWTT